MTDSLGPVPAVDEVPEQCGRVWGYHREHWCEERRGHQMQHFCDCDTEADEDMLMAIEAES